VRKTLSLLIGAILVAVAASLVDGGRHGEAHEIERIQQAYHDLEYRTETILGDMADGTRSMADLRELWQQELIGVVIYDDGEATAWSTKLLPFAVSFGPRDKVQSGLVKLRNGWYVCRTVEANGQLLAAYALVKTEYGFANRHVRSGWNPVFNTDARHTITYSETDTHALRSADGTVVAYVRLAADASGASAPAAILWLVAFGLLLALAWSATDTIEQTIGAAWAAIALAACLVFIRGLMLWAHIPVALYANESFGPAQYASSWLLPSLGDLLLHLICLLLVIFRLPRITMPERVLGNAHPWVLLLVSHLLLWPAYLLLRTLVVDAAFPLDLNMPFSLTWFSIIGLAASFLVLLAYYLLLGWLMRTLRVKSVDHRHLILPFVSGLLLSSSVGLAIGDAYPMHAVAMGGLMVAFMLLVRVWSVRLRGFSLFTPAVLVFTLFATVVLQTELNRNEHEQRKALAGRLNIQQDPITEYLYKELEQTLLADRDLRNALSKLPDNDAQVLELLHRRLRYDHWNRYRAVVNLFDANGHLLATDLAVSGPNYHEMERQFAASRPTLADNMRYVANADQEAGYMARITFNGRRTQPDLVLYVQFTPQGSNDLLGFSDLFIDEGVSITRLLEGYSFARYSDDVLKEQVGEFRYGLRGDDFESIRDEFGCMVIDGFDHLVYRPYDSAMVVVSRPVNTILDHLTIFSYLFLFYFGCVVLMSAAEGSLLAVFMARKSFRNRINLAMAGMLTVSLLVIGLMTVYYVVNEYRARNRAIIAEKSRSVLVELEHKLNDRTELLRKDRPMLHPLLLKFSKVFFTDINLYGLDGKLLSSSRPRVFKEGLMAQVMDPVAYEEMRFRNRSSFIHTENIGRLEYQAAYVPFRNQSGDIIAFLSIPYFARQYSLQQEVISLLAALINIYVFLILMAVVLALIISNRITEPLRIIRDSLRDLRLDNSNRTIEWNSDDEIGELVKEYNRTLSELVRSAETLARSEREGAWREMAKQVAHEIKNPLTPMKLNIQMLQRSYRDGAPDIGDRIERMTRSLIEQIDALSNIASEFSSFAQMPRPVLEAVDLHQLLESVATLNQHSDTKVLLSIRADGPCIMKADREQMLRVFNNLVKNALQAIPEDKEGTITLGLIRDNDHWVASVQDNGTGIPEELRERVFVPNFTTKSAGMGLGLAMVQRIVESVGGHIWFTTETSVGTTFYLRLPMADSSN
jgi:two-component system, NtrC family, nitrogen regulation sensor histidine kinase NtrY